MKVVSITAIMIYLLSIALNLSDPGITFWNVIYGFAAMLAVFHLLNLKVGWVAGFGVLAYSVIAVKLASTPASASSLNVQTWHIAGLVVAALFCGFLLVTTHLRATR